MVERNQVYVYAWGNTSKCATMKGRRCVLLHSLSMGSAHIRFLDNGQEEITSRRALRRAHD